MKELWKAVFGSGNRMTTAAGIGAVAASIGGWLQSGEFDANTFGIGMAGLVGLLSRGGGTGSDAPSQ